MGFLERFGGSSQESGDASRSKLTSPPETPRLAEVYGACDVHTPWRDVQDMERNYVALPEKVRRYIQGFVDEPDGAANDGALRSGRFDELMKRFEKERREQQPEFRARERARIVLESDPAEAGAHLGGLFGYFLDRRLHFSRQYVARKKRGEADAVMLGELRAAVTRLWRDGLAPGASVDELKENIRMCEGEIAGIEARYREYVGKRSDFISRINNEKNKSVKSLLRSHLESLRRMLGDEYNRGKPQGLLHDVRLQWESNQRLLEDAKDTLGDAALLEELVRRLKQCGTADALLGFVLGFDRWSVLPPAFKSKAFDMLSEWMESPDAPVVLGSEERASVEKRVQKLSRAFEDARAYLHGAHAEDTFASVQHAQFIMRSLLRQLEKLS